VLPGLILGEVAGTTVWKKLFASISDHRTVRPASAVIVVVAAAST